MPAWLIKLLWQAAPYLVAAAAVGFGILMAKKASRESENARKWEGIAKAHKAAAEANAATEAERKRITEESNEREAAILANSDAVTPGLSYSSGAKHNHPFGEPCTPDCPAYGGGD